MRPLAALWRLTKCLSICLYTNLASNAYAAEATQKDVILYIHPIMELAQTGQEEVTSVPLTMLERHIWHLTA